MTGFAVIIARYWMYRQRKWIKLTYATITDLNKITYNCKVKHEARVHKVYKSLCHSSLNLNTDHIYQELSTPVTPTILKYFCTVRSIRPLITEKVCLIRTISPGSDPLTAQFYWEFGRPLNSDKNCPVFKPDLNGVCCKCKNISAKCGKAHLYRSFPTQL